MATEGINNMVKKRNVEKTAITHHKEKNKTERVKKQANHKHLKVKDINL